MKIYSVAIILNIREWNIPKKTTNTNKLNVQVLSTREIPRSPTEKKNIKGFDGLRKHLPASGFPAGLPRSIFSGPLEIDRSHGRRMMRLDGTRRETGATDYSVVERAHLGRFSLSLSLLPQHLQPSLSPALSVSPLFLHTSSMSISFSLLPLFELRRWRWRRAHPFYSAVNTIRVCEDTYTYACTRSERMRSDARSIISRECDLREIGGSQESISSFCSCQFINRY